MHEDLYTLRLMRAPDDPPPHSPHYQALMRMFAYLARPVSQGRLAATEHRWNQLSGDFSFLAVEHLSEAVERIGSAFLLDRPGRAIEIGCNGATYRAWTPQQATEWVASLR